MNSEGRAGRTRRWASRAWQLAYASGLLVPLSYLLLVGAFAPLRDPREFDWDEGLQLIKALLVTRGHALYSQIFSDQPPVFTLLLARVLAWFGASITAGRVLALVFAALLLWSFYQTVRRHASEPAALAAVAALALSQYYVRLSVSVMIGLPALALGMLAVYLFAVAWQRQRTWLAGASGVVLAVSMQTKLFTFLIAAAGSLVLLTVLARLPRGSRAPRCKLAGAWLAALLVGFVALGLAFRTFDLEQLVGIHLQTAAGGDRSYLSNVPFVAGLLKRHALYVLLAVIGGIWALRARRPGYLFPAVWLLLNLLGLLYERPAWYHYVLLLTIPLCWLCAPGLDACLAGLRHLTGQNPKAWRRAGQAGVACACLALAGLAIYRPEPLRSRVLDELPRGIPYDSWVVSRLCPGGRPRDGWVWSDRPYYAFLAGQSEPPAIAAFSGKTFYSESYGQDHLLAELSAAHPRYVVLERFSDAYAPAFLDALTTLYVPVARYPSNRAGTPGQLWRARATDNGSDRRQALFDGWLSLSWAANSPAQPARAGDCLEAPYLVWSRGNVAGRDLAISLRLTDANGNAWLQQDEQLGRDGNTLRDTDSVITVLDPLVPAGTPPGNYQLRLVVYDPPTFQPLQAVQDGQTTEQIVLGQVEVRP